MYLLLRVNTDLLADHLNANVGDSVLLAANVRDSTYPIQGVSSTKSYSTVTLFARFLG